MMDLGYDGPLSLRQEEIRNAAGIRILYLSDLHFNRHSARLVRRLQQLLLTTPADVVLLGGDYADTRAGLFYFEALLETLVCFPHCLAVAGNHDTWVGISCIRVLLEKYGVKWLEGRGDALYIRGKRLWIDGNCPSDRPADIRVLCLHRPIQAPPDYDLVLAGHLHGSQVVFWEHRQRLYPGRWFYRWNILATPHGQGGRYVVSRGIGDTLPLRINCPREIILATV